jgi:hypothetical protein
MIVEDEREEEDDFNYQMGERVKSSHKKHLNFRSLLKIT